MIRSLGVPRKIWLGALLAVLAGAPAAATVLSGVSLTPSESRTGLPVEVALERAGNHSCGVRVDFGDGSPVETLLVPAAGKTLSHRYVEPGTYDVIVRPWAGGTNANGRPRPACSGTPLQAAPLVVKSPSLVLPTTPRPHAAPAPSGVLVPVNPDAEE